jgi:hypothetical protein
VSHEREKDTLSPEELEALDGEELPDREVMSTLMPPGIDEIGRFPDLGPEPAPEGAEDKPGPQPA